MRAAKRGMRGVYQHCGEKPIGISISAEFDFRYNNRSALGVTDTERTEELARGTEGKRLTYRPTKPKSPSQKAKAFIRWRKEQN